MNARFINQSTVHIRNESTLQMICANIPNTAGSSNKISVRTDDAVTCKRCISRQEKLNYLDAVEEAARARGGAEPIIAKSQSNESAASEPTMLERMTRQAIDSANENVETTFARLAEWKVSRIDSQWSPIGDYLKALALRDLMVTVEKIWNWVGPDGEKRTLAEAIIEVADERVDRLLKGYLVARSTSVIANTLSAVEAEVAVEFIRSWIVLGARKGEQ